MLERLALIAAVALTVVFMLVLGGPPVHTGVEESPAAAVSADTEAIDAFLADSQDLSLDVFLDASCRQLLLRDPEWITDLGLGDLLGRRNDRLADRSDAYIRETQRLEAAILERLQGVDPSMLPPSERASFESTLWTLDDRVRSHRFTYHDTPVTPIVISFPSTLIQFFTDIHPVADRRGAEDYVTRLAQVGLQFDQILDGLRRRETIGAVPPRFILDWVQRDVRGIANGSARRLPFYTAFEEKLEALDALSPTERQGFLEDAEREIERTVIPAFRSLADYLSALHDRASDDAGVWRVEDGDAYYAHALRHQTTTEMTPDEVHTLGLQEVERIQAEIRDVADELGYPEEDSLSLLFQRVATDGGLLRGEAILAEYESLIADAQKAIVPAFSRFPQADLVVVDHPVGGFYVPPSLDSRPGVFYARAQGEEPRYRMPTLAHHEAVPGHHFQIALSQEVGLPLCRVLTQSNAYAEGWALYAERLAWELGRYDDDPYGNLGRLQDELFRAVRLVVDTGIHARRWTYGEAVGYMEENAALPRGRVEYEVARYIVWPGQAVSYKIGMIKILELRQRAMDQLGEAFDLQAFHAVILENGNVPLAVLERLVEDWILDTAGS